MAVRSIKKIIKTIFILFLIVFFIAYIYSLHAPVKCNVDKIGIIRYKGTGKLAEDFENIRKSVINGSIESDPNYQYFYGAECFDLESEPSDYIRAVYYCTIKNNSLSTINQGKIIVSDIPRNDPAFLRAHLNDMVFIYYPSAKNETIGITINTKALTEEEIEEKIRNVSLSFLYDNKGKRKVADLTGIDSCDISYMEWTYD